MKTFVQGLVFMLLMCGCATAKYTVTEDVAEPGCKPADKKCKGTKTRVEVDYTGTSFGARALVDAETRRRQAVTEGNIAQTAANQGKPVLMNSTPDQRSLTTGYQYGYGGYGMYANSPFVMAEQATFGYIHPGSLPPLSESSVQHVGSFHAPAVVLQENGVCPPNRDAVTAAERIACLEQDRDRKAKQHKRR